MESALSTVCLALRQQMIQVFKSSSSRSQTATRERCCARACRMDPDVRMQEGTWPCAAIRLPEAIVHLCFPHHSSSHASYLLVSILELLAGRGHDGQICHPCARQHIRPRARLAIWRMLLQLVRLQLDPFRVRRQLMPLLPRRLMQGKAALRRRLVHSRTRRLVQVRRGRLHRRARAAADAMLPREPGLVLCRGMLVCTPTHPSATTEEEECAETEQEEGAEGYADADACLRACGEARVVRYRC